MTESNNTINIKELILENNVNTLPITISYFRIACSGYIFLEQLYLIYGYNFMMKIADIVDQRYNKDKYNCNISTEKFIIDQSIHVNFTNFDANENYSSIIYLYNYEVNLK